jgi:hypothetical protein
VKFRVLSFRVKILGLALIYCWRHCFESGDYFQGENLKYLIGRRRYLCTVPFLDVSLLKSMELKCYFGGGCILAARAGIP